jgi:biotin synthase
MKPDTHVDRMIKGAAEGRPITKAEAVLLLGLPENSLEASLLRAVATAVNRRRFGNSGLLLGQIGVDMAPCDGDCAFCFFAKSHTSIEAALLPTDEIVARCEGFARGGAQGVFLMTMHRFGFDWYRDLCAELRRRIPSQLEILANVGDVSAAQLRDLRAAGVTGAYHVCRIREGVDSCMSPAARRGTIERILDAGLSWYNMCEPLGPEHTPEELADQIWLGVDLPCTQHGVMQRFPVPGSPLYHHGQVSLSRLGQVAAVVTLATIGRESVKSIAINVSNMVGLFSGANAFFPEAGEPDEQPMEAELMRSKDGFTTALWRQSNEITTLDCRGMMLAAGFSQLMGTDGRPNHPLRATAYRPVLAATASP